MKSYKTEIQLNTTQIIQFYKTIGVCRFVYNLFIDVNKERYEYDQPFVDGYKFSKWLNNIYLLQNPDKEWIKEVSTKSVKQSIMNADKAFKRFFKLKKGYPRYKNIKNNNCNMYFVKNGDNQPIVCERHRIKIPTLGWVKLKEFGYLPTKQDIISGSISLKAGRFFVSVTTKEEVMIQNNNQNRGIGIDLGIKSFVVLSDGTVFKNINKTSRIKRLKKGLKRTQKSLSRKYENKKKKGGEGKNIKKNIIRLQRIHQTLTNLREDYQNKIVREIVRTKSSFITMESLNVSGMMKNRHLSKAIAEQKFNRFIELMKCKANQNSIEFRQVNPFYPSSKKCSKCGIIKKDLKLSDRVYKCECGLVIDRDLNAAINLAQATDYKVVH
jgi:putative transposase